VPTEIACLSCVLLQNLAPPAFFASLCRLISSWLCALRIKLCALPESLVFEQTQRSPTILFLKRTFVHRNKRNVHTTRTPPWLGVWFVSSLWSSFSGLARSGRLDPCACSFNARGAQSPTNSALLIFHVSLFAAPGKIRSKNERQLTPLTRSAA